jgi:hypothetical protein
VHQSNQVYNTVSTHGLLNALSWSPKESRPKLDVSVILVTIVSTPRPFPTTVLRNVTKIGLDFRAQEASARHVMITSIVRGL